MAGTVHDKYFPLKSSHHKSLEEQIIYLSILLSILAVVVLAMSILNSSTFTAVVFLRATQIAARPSQNEEALQCACNDSHRQ